MKKLIALALSALLTLAIVGEALAATDLSAFKNDSLYTIDLDDDGDAFVESVIGKTKFIHSKSLEEYPSYVYSDVLVIDYFSATPNCYWRFWVNYSAEKYLGITSMTIKWKDEEYTFINVGGKDQMTNYNTNVRETPLIIFGGNNMKFWLSFILSFEVLENKMDFVNETMEIVLHGISDETITIDGYALLDLALVGEAYVGACGIDGLMGVDGTELLGESSSLSTSSSYSSSSYESPALKQARSYLSHSAFSYSGLVEQLEYHGYSHAESVAAANACGANWKEQALKKAQSYLRTSAFSQTGLIEQLEYEGFTKEEANYGVDHCGANWKEQASKKAASYLKHGSWSRSKLIDQLEYEGFTYEQASYGASQNGY